MMRTQRSSKLQQQVVHRNQGAIAYFPVHSRTRIHHGSALER